MAPAPLVRAVVVNYGGGDVTIDCLDALRATAWPAGRLEIVLVDNDSRDGVADTVERDLTDVRVVRSPVNRGFAGGCNLGLSDLGDTEYVALVNNDAVVTSAWLEPLVDALADDPALGAACPKILLTGSFRELAIRVPAMRRAGRDVGLWVSGARVAGADAWPRAQLLRGWHGLEPPDLGWPPGQWTGSDALLRLPVPEAGASGDLAELQVAAARSTTASVTSGQQTREVEVGTRPAWVGVPLSAPDLSVVNNAGSVLTTDLHGADRGYLEPDDGRYGAPEDVFAWCGAAVLLRRTYVDDVGPMDERLFLYYEDLEHAWRGRQRGWRYRYIPAAVVTHRHATTTIEGSPLKFHYEERNRLLVLVRHARATDAWRAVVGHLLVTASYARRDIIGRLARGRRPGFAIVGRRLRAFSAFAVRFPGALRSRRRDRRAQVERPSPS